MSFIENQFQDAVKKASIVSVADTKGIITYVNENFITISGYSGADLIGQNHRIVNSGYHPQSFWADMWRTIASGQIWRNDVKNRAKDGSFYWVDTFILPFFNQQGQLTEYLSIRNDITLRKSAEEEIQKLSGIVKFTTNAVIITDKLGYITWINEGFERITGYTLSECMGKKPGSFLAGPDTDQTVVNFMSDKIRRFEGFRVDILNYTKNGVKYWMDIDVRPLISENEVTGFMAIQTNITEKKEYELKLKESEERLSLAIEAANIGIWDWDIVNDVSTTNDRWFEMLGYKVDEISSSLKKFQKLIHPADLPMVLLSIQEHLDGQTGYLEYEFRARSKSGNYVWLFVRGKVVARDKNKLPLRILGTTLDINERKLADTKVKESEARFRHVSDSAPVLIWMSGIDKKIIYFNKSWLLFTGRKLEDELEDGWMDGVHSDDKNFCIQVYTDSFRMKVPFTMSIRLRNEDQVYRWVMVNGVPRFDTEENFLGFIGSCIDITENKEITEKLETNQYDLQRLLIEKDLLIQEIHHRVKNNLQVISSVLFLKSQTLTDSVSKEILIDTRQRLRSMAIIHERLMQSGGQITQVDIYDYLSSLIEELKLINYYAENNIIYQTDLDHYLMNLEQVVNCGFIINETVTNAAKHAFPDKRDGIIFISFKIKKEYFELQIKDNGVGLPWEGSLNNTDFFGIQLVKVFVQQLKGHVFVENKEGTTWIIRFQNPEI